MTICFRLPIVQGGCGAFFAPMFAIISMPELSFKTECGAFTLNPRANNITVLLCYCVTVLLCYCVTVLLCLCHTYVVRLSHTLAHKRNLLSHLQYKLIVYFNYHSVFFLCTNNYADNLIYIIFYCSYQTLNITLTSWKQHTVIICA